MPPSQSYKRRRVACQHSPDDQTLRPQAGAGEDDVIHLPSSLDRVVCERQEEKEDACLGGRLVALTSGKASSSRVADLGPFARDLSSRSNHTSDLEVDTPLAAMPGAWGRHHGGRRPSSVDSFFTAQSSFHHRHSTNRVS